MRTAIVVFFLLLLAASTAAAAAVFQTIEADTVWGGTVDSPDDVVVAAGATLLVMPGTTLRFAGSAGSELEGKSGLIVREISAARIYSGPWGR